MSATPNTPTPSEVQARDWAARESGPRRSIFGNYARMGDQTAAVSPEERPAPGSETSSFALARAFVYRTLAQAFEYPSLESWRSLTSPENMCALEAAIAALQNPGIEQATVERTNSSRKGVARGTLRRFSNSSSDTAMVRTVSRPSTISARETVLTGSWPAGR